MHNRSVQLLIETRVYLLAPILILASMPIAYVLGLVAVVPVFAVGMFALIVQGLRVVASAGRAHVLGPIGRYGWWVMFYGVVSIGITIWFTLIATFGGPARDDVPWFLLTLWLIESGICLPPAVILRNRAKTLITTSIDKITPVTGRK